MAAMKSSGRNRLPLFILMGLTVALLALGGIGYLLIGRPVTASKELLRPTSQDGMVLYEVPRNVSTAILARDLHEKGLIAFPLVFKLFVRLTHQDKGIRAGFYYLPPRNSVLEMAF